jgi:hypothetical protein
MISTDLPKIFQEAKEFTTKPAAHLSNADRRKGNTMALERNQDGIPLPTDLARSHEQPSLHDKDITIVMFQLVCVPIVEFSAPQSCEHECSLIASTT